MVDGEAALGATSSISGPESRYRRYQRTASVVSSGGNRNPTNADRSTFRPG